MAASHPHVRISAAESMLAVWSTRLGGGAPRGARTRRPSIPYGARGPSAAIPWSLRPTGAQGPFYKSPWVAVGCADPTPLELGRRTALLGFPVRVLLRTIGSIRSPIPRPQCALPMRSWNCVR